MDSGDIERLILFSDAVIAIAITLLALELPVPRGTTIGAFGRSVHEEIGHYVAFLLSFVVIASMWIQHHRVFRYAARCDSGLLYLNLLWLLAIVLNPFATKLLTDGARDSLATHAVRFSFYAVLQVLAVTTFLAIVHRMVSRNLLADGTPPRLRAIADDASYGVLAAFGLSIPLFFVTKYAWLLWVILPGLLSRLRRWRRHRSA
jgi:uncharacterized membrane protein